MNPAPAARRLSADTSDDVERRLVEIWRGMSPAEKAAQLTASFLALAELSAAGVRQRFPLADAEEVRRRVAVLRLGKDLAREVYGWDFPDGV